MAEFGGNAQYPNAAPTFGFGAPDPTGLGSAIQQPDPGYWDWYNSVMNGGAPAPVVNPGPSYNENKDPTRLVNPVYLDKPPTTRTVTTVPVNKSPPLPIPRPNVTPKYTTLPQRSPWLPPTANAYKAAKMLAAMPSVNNRSLGTLNIPVTPSRSAPATPAVMPPATWTGTATGRNYTVGQPYQAGAYQYMMTPNGPQRQGLAPQYAGMSPSQAYAAASNYDPVANGREWAVGIPGGAAGGGSGRYDL